jgi:hypothetical protein
MHKRKSIRILYVVHLFCGRGRKRVPIDIIKARLVRSAVKLNGVVLGWANHRANRLVDLAALTFRFCEASAIAQGVGWSALHSFGCTARQARYAEIKNARRRINARTRNQFFKRANNANKMR